MLKMGMIGAGNIASYQLKAVKELDNCEIVAIADMNIENARSRADEFGIKDCYSDYKELLQDESIEAVSIITPTFTHKQIVIDALKSGKHVLCEKPPMLNAQEVRECEKVAEECGKILMFAFVCRFSNHTQYLKKYIEAGKMGEFVSAECFRVNRCSPSNGWFASREKGGGVLIDECIHDLDVLMYLMGYPDVKYVAANESFVNKDLPVRFNSKGWASFDTNTYEKSIESSIEGFVVLENGASIRVKTAKILNSINVGRNYEITGSKAGARFENNAIKMVEISDECFVENQPDIPSVSGYEREIDHFVDCILNGTECIVKLSEAVKLMEIIDGLYKSAETKLPVIFE